MRMLVLLMLSQRSLKDCPHFFLFFFLILIHGSDFHHSIFQLTHPVFCLIYSDIYSIYCIFSFQLLYYSSVCFLFFFFFYFSDSSDGKESTCNAGDPGSIPGSGRSAGEGIGYPLQYSWALFSF